MPVCAVMLNEKHVEVECPPECHFYSLSSMASDLVKLTSFLLLTLPISPHHFDAGGETPPEEEPVPPEVLANCFRYQASIK